jgi:pectate lyase
MTTLRLLAACFAALVLSLPANAATILDDSFSDSNSLNQNLAANSVQVFKARSGTTRTDAAGSVTYGQTQTSAEAHWFHFTETTPVALQVGDSITASVTFSLTTPAASGGTVRFGLFDSKTTRLLVDKASGQSDALLTDDPGYMGQLATDANASVGPFTWLGRRDTLTTTNLFNSTADFPVLSSLTAGSTDRVALASGVPYTLSMSVLRQSSTVNVVTLSITGGSLPSTYTYVGTDNGAATSSYAFDWFGFRYSGSNLASAVVFTNLKVVYTPSSSSVAAPVISAQPTFTGGQTSLTANAGTATALSVTATGTGLTYQWKKQGVDVSGATSSTLNFASLLGTDSGTYTVVVSNAGGSVTSNAASLNVVAPGGAYTPDGFAASVTGGAAGPTVNVSTAATLRQYAEAAASSPYTIVVSGTIDLGAAGRVNVKSNKTIKGADTSATILGTLTIDNATNVIVSNLNVSANTGAAAENDGITIAASTNVLVTKCTIYDCTDGNLDVVNGSDLVTISWCKFYYTRDNGHNFSNLIGSSDSDLGTGSYRVSWHHNWWSTGAKQRMLACRFGGSHMFNNYWDCAGDDYCTEVRNIAEMLSEYNYYNGVKDPLAKRTALPNDQGKLKTINNVFNACTGSQLVSSDVVFTPTYSYQLAAAADVPALVMAGAGNVAVDAPAVGTAAITGAASVNAGAGITLTAVPTGFTPTTYQWRFKNADIAGATSSTLTIASAQSTDAGDYSVAIARTGGAVVVSARHSLAVNAVAVAPAITTQPVSQTVTEGAGASFTVVASGTAPLTYQWKKGGVDIGGATNATYTIAATVAGDAGSYTVFVSNAAGNATSNAATLTVNAAGGGAPVITTQPASQNVVAGSTVTLSVVSSGSSLTYQWKKNGVDISGATGASLVLSNATTSDAGEYTVVVTGGGSVTSTVARLAVAPAGALAWQSYNATTGARISADAAVFNPATGTYTFTIPANSTQTLVTSSFVPLVLAKPASGSVTLPVSFSMISSGGYGTNGSVQFAYTGFGLFNNGGTPAGATGNFTDDKGLWIEFYQSANAVSMKPQSVTSAVPFCPVGLMALDINSPYGMGTGTGGALGTISDNTLIDMTVRPAALASGTVQLGTSASTVAASGGVFLDRATGGTVVNRRVYSSASSGLSVASASITFNEFGYQFQNATANPVTLQLSNFTGITPPPYFTTQPPSSMIVTVGESVTLSTVVAGNPTTLQWQVSTDGGATFADISAASNASAATAALTLTNAQVSTAGIYQLIATNAAGSTASAQVTVTISATPFAPVIALQPVSTTVTAGNAATFSVTASGTSPMTYQWRKSTDGGTTYADVTGATSASLVFASATIADSGLYVVRLTNAQGTLTSTAATFTVNQSPLITTQPASANPAAGSSLTLSVAATASPAPTYQWKKNGVSISGATSSSLALNNVTGADTANYTVTVTNAAGGVTSAIASVNVLSTSLAASSMTPANAAAAVLPDAPLTITFNQAISAGLSGKIKIFDAASPATPVDTIDFTSANARTSSAALLALPIQSKTIGTLAGFNYYPVTISGNTATIFPRNLTLTYGKTYYVTVDAGVFTDSTGLAFPGITNTTTWTFTTKAAPATATTYTVAKDGTGDFATVQGALDFIPAANTTPTTIYIKNGTYYEIVYWVSKNQLTIRGESRTGTIVGYPNNNTLNPQGTNGRAAFEGRSSTGTVLTNLTIKNFTPIGGTQAEALYFNNAASAQTIITGVNLSSFQDTLNVNGPTYISDTYIEGDVDFMWGGGPVFFERCELKMRTSGGYYTQVRNGTANHGFVYVNCLFSAAAGVTNAYLGRLDQNTPAQTEMVLINCVEADNVLLPVAWELNTNTSAQALANTLCVEYNATKQSDGTPVVTTGRAAWSFQWTQPANATQIANYSDAYWVLNTSKAGVAGANTWTPALAPMIVSQPASATVDVAQPVSFTVVASAIPAATYQWKKNGTNIAGATSATYTIASPAVSDAGSYTVTVTNSGGTATSSAAALLVGTAPAITTQPVNLSVNVGASATFTATASGTGPLTYQWQKNSVNIAGATSATLTISPVQTADAASYRVVVSNAVGSATSNAATLTVGTVFTAPTPDGYAASVTGGGTAGVAVNATTAADFRTYAEDSTARTITVSGTLNLGATKVAVKSNKTIQGVDGNATLIGNLELASGVSNVVIRGLNITNPNAGGDGISLVGATNVYITHCTLFDCADGLIDITAGADNVTVSWCEFYYTTAQTAHRYAMTIGAASGETKALRVSLHHNWWSDRADQSLPSTTYGQVHMYNDLFTSTGNTSGSTVLANAQLLSERNQYAGVASPLTKSSGGLIRANNNVYTTVTGTAADAGTDTVFTPAYSYEMLVAADVAAIVQAGAGNTAGAASGSLAAASATITASGTSITTGGAFTLTASATGFTGTAYQWRLNNAPIANATSATYTVASAATTHAGVYTVVITKSTGDVVSTPVTITVTAPVVPPAPPAAQNGGGGGAPSLWFFGALSLTALLHRLTTRRAIRTTRAG